MSLVVLFALSAAVLLSIHNVASKFLVANSGVGAVPASFLLQAFAGLVAVPLLVLASPAWALNAVPFILAAAAIMQAAFILMLLALAREDASSVGPVLGLKVIFVAVLESIIDRQDIGLGVWLGAALSVVGVAFVSQTDHWSLHPRDILRPGILMIGGTALAFATTDILIEQAIGYWQGNSWYVTLTLLIVSGALGAIGYLSLPRIRTIIQACGLDCAVSRPALRAGMLPLGIAVATHLLGMYLFFTSFAVGGQVTLSNILMNARTLFIVIIMASLVTAGRGSIEQGGKRALLYRASGALFIIGAILVALLW